MSSRYPEAPSSFSVLSCEAWSVGGELEGGVPLYNCSAVLCSSTVCVYEMRARPFVVAVELKDKGSGGKMGTEYGSRSGPRWESDGGGEPPDQLEVSEWTLPGGPGGEVTEGGLVVSCQLLASRR